MVFLVLDVVLLVGFFGRSKSSTPTQQQSLNQRPTSTTGGTIRKTPAQGNATNQSNVIPLKTDHPAVKAAQVTYLITTPIKTVSAEILELANVPIPQLSITDKTKIVRVTDQQSHIAALSDLSPNQVVTVEVKYYMKTKKWELLQITLYTTSTPTPSSQ